MIVKLTKEQLIALFSSSKVPEGDEFHIEFTNVPTYDPVIFTCNLCQDTGVVKVDGGSNRSCDCGEKYK